MNARPAELSAKAFALCGSVLDAPAWGTLRAWPEGAVLVDGGRILAAGPETEIAAAFPDLPPRAWQRAPQGERWAILPGLTDVHAHLPQYPAVARAEEALLPWLKRHIFPVEKDFRAARPDLEEELDAFFADLAASGTTTVMLYAAVWGDSTDLAFAAAQRSGLRVLMGKVMMDVGTYGAGSEWPPERTRQVSLAETRHLLERWHGRDSGRLEVVVSPRFAVTCSAELMAAAAVLAKDWNCAVQTHLSENHGEIAAVAALFPDAPSYTAVYHRAGLLGPRTVLGHCLHLTPDEISLLADTGAKVAHCPTSNLFLNSGLCPLDRLRAAGLGIGLGSDVAAGPELNLWQVMRSAVETQKVRRFADPDIPELTPAQALHLATAAGAAVVGKADVTGRLDPGCEADLGVWDLNAVLPLQGRFTPGGALDAPALAALLVYRGGPHALRQSFVRGKRVAGAADPSR